MSTDTHPHLIITMMRQPLSMKEQYHARLTTTVTGDRAFCAESHCRGACGLPALFLRLPAEVADRRVGKSGPADFKCHGAMVACGPVWQPRHWDGERVYLPEALCTEELLDMIWW